MRMKLVMATCTPSVAAVGASVAQTLFRTSLVSKGRAEFTIRFLSDGKVDILIRISTLTSRSPFFRSTSLVASLALSCVGRWQVRRSTYMN